MIHGHSKILYTTPLLHALGVHTPLHSIFGLEHSTLCRHRTSSRAHNYSITRWDLQRGPLRHMDRTPVAHSGPILTLDWGNAAASTGSQRRDSVSDDGNLTVNGGSSAPSGGWIVSGGLDRTVKVRCLTTRSPLWNIKMNVF